MGYVIFTFGRYSYKALHVVPAKQRVLKINQNKYYLIIGIMKSLLKVLSVELVDGFLPPYHREYSASGVSVTKAKCLKVKGYVDGLGDVCFFSPSVLIKTTYNSNTEFTHVDDNKWIGYNDDNKSSNSTNDLPSYVQFGKKIFPLINEGDEINVSFSVKGVYGKTTAINRVKIIN